MWLLLLFAIISIFVYVKYIKPLNYWKNRGIPYQQGWPIVGNMMQSILQKKSFVDIFLEYYNTFPSERYNGIFQFARPILLIRDPDLARQITVKDFDYFTDHNFTISEDVDPLMGKNLIALKGQRWRDMRATLSPSFTGSKMRMLYTLLKECSEQFTAYFVNQNKDLITVEMKDIFTRFTNDAIASVAFGLKVDSLEEKENEFYLMGKDATNFNGFYRRLKFILVSTSPTLAKLLRMRFLSNPVSKFFRRVIKETLDEREKKGLVRPDMIHLLMEARKGRLHNDQHLETKEDTGFATVEESHITKSVKHQKIEISDDDITAQAIIFFFGGFETSATLMAFIAYELALNPDIQDKLQKEIDKTVESRNGHITYEAIMGMKYLDMVVSETLRKWPPGFTLDRECVKDYTIQPVKPSEKPVTIEKGQHIMIDVIGIHRDPKYFPNPEKFDPERFSDENKHNITSAYMPFGSGPRSCIASRFALMENKTLICHLLSKFNIIPVKETPIPLRLGRKTLNFMPDEGFWLGLQKRKLNGK